MDENTASSEALNAQAEKARAAVVAALISKARMLYSQIEHSEQAVHSRIRKELREFFDVADAGGDISDTIAKIHVTIELATAEAALKQKKYAEAKTFALRALERHGKNPDFLLCLGRIAVGEKAYDDALTYFRDAADAGAPEGVIYYQLALMYQEKGDIEQAKALWAEGFPGGYYTIRKSTGARKPLRVLVVTSPLIGNVRYRLFMKPEEFHLIQFTADSFVNNKFNVPHYDVAFSAIGDADLCALSVDRAIKLMPHIKKPLLNLPTRVALTGRDMMSKRLNMLDDIVAARIERFTKAELLAPDAAKRLEDKGFTFPLLLRAPGFQNGSHFDKVDHPSKLAETVAEQPKDEVFVLSYLDTRSPEGVTRKYRVLRINGKMYPIHLAMSSNWKIHYHSSDMADNDLFRAEERRYLYDMHGYLGQRSVKALESVFDMLGLDYAGIDFSLEQDGRVVVYEANATMAILTPNADERWNYRREPIQNALDAAARMLHDRASGGVPKAA